MIIYEIIIAMLDILKSKDEPWPRKDYCGSCGYDCTAIIRSDIEFCVRTCPECGITNVDSRSE